MRVMFSEILLRLNQLRRGTILFGFQFVVQYTRCIEERLFQQH